MKIKYKTVNTRTEKGLKEAERLKAAGWKVGSVGFDTIQFYTNDNTKESRISEMNMSKAKEFLQLVEGKYDINNQKELRAAFWRDHEGLPGISKKKIKSYSGNGTMHDTDTRVAFVDYVDYLSKDGRISQELAQRATLD